MPTKYTVTLSTMGTSSVIVMPKPVVDGFGLKKGQKIDLIVTDAGINIPLVENPIVAPVEADIQAAVRRKQTLAEKKAQVQTVRGP